MTRLLLLVALLSVAAAEDLTTLDGKTYKAVTVKKVESDGLSIIHEAGTAKVKFANLPEEVQQKYGYDPVLAEAVAKADAEKLAEARRVAKEKREANEWDNRFKFDPETQDRLTLEYSSFEEGVRELRELAVRDRLSRLDTEQLVALAPKGGKLWGVMREPTSDDAAKHKFTVLLFDREGNKLKMRPDQMNFEVTKGPDGLWQRIVSVVLLSPLQEGDRISIVDKLDNRHRDFTVKAK